MRLHGFSWQVGVCVRGGAASAAEKSPTYLLMVGHSIQRCSRPQKILNHVFFLSAVSWKSKNHLWEPNQGETSVDSGAGLSGAGLSGAGLSGAGLSGAGLSGAGLSGAGLSGAGLSETLQRRTPAKSRTPTSTS
ncbi:Hypothetical predicted protein [Marmota monax]|uniref:Uncharacterized protein n=1 Tax=Marmota monax TaxID=9995 RepID=A0A5E4D426_MARMO|nr:Hypothetical predicted protein [Marmota monax]